MILINICITNLKLVCVNKNQFSDQAIGFGNRINMKLDRLRATDFQLCITTNQTESGNCFCIQKIPKEGPKFSFS